MKQKPPPPCRLFPIFAREAPRVVIFRRGPTDWTQLILWHTDSDRFEFGQWFKGRVFERRADLSPDGTKLIYFARKMEQRTRADPEYTYSWTAISKPPYYTALALWPKGDSWCGGGLFEDNQTVFLNHAPMQAVPHPDHVPQNLTVRPNQQARGEDEPIFSEHLTRDGWEVQQEWVIERAEPPIYFRTTQPDVRVKRNPSKNYVLSMTRRLDRFKYNETFEARSLDGRSLMDTNKVSWLNWDQGGRLVFFKQGKLSLAEEVSELSFQEKELADFNPQKPESIRPPEWAAHW